MSKKIVIVMIIYGCLLTSSNIKIDEHKNKKIFDIDKNGCLLNKQEMKKMNTDFFKHLDSWIDNKENLQKLIKNFLYNNLRFTRLNMTTIIISDIYQYSLYKKTLFRTIALKSMINECCKKTCLILSDFENKLSCSILKNLTKIEIYLSTIKNIDILTLYNYYYKNDNISIYTKMIELKINILNYFKTCRAIMCKDFVYDICCDYDKETLNFFIIKYHILISSMIEVFCRTLFIIENEQIKELVVLSSNANKNEETTFYKAIKNNYRLLEELSSLIFYNADKYNRFINNNIEKLKKVMNYTFWPINSKNLTAIAMEILFDIKITVQKHREVNNVSYFFYYLSNRRDENRINFLNTKKIMLQCCLNEWPTLKLFTINLKSFNKFKSVLDHIKIAIEIDIELLRNLESNNSIVYCKCRLIPIALNIENLNEKFKKRIFKAMKGISRFDKIIKISYDQHKSEEEKYSFNKNERCYDIINIKDSFIHKNFLEKEQMYEVLKLELKAYEKCNNNGNLIIYGLTLTTAIEYYQSNNSESYVRRVKQTQLYPIYESPPQSNSNKKTYFYCYYIHNPEFRNLKHKSIVVYDLMFKNFNAANVKDVIFDTENFINDWFETNILYSNLSGGFYNIVPFKYVSSWMSYITFRSLLHNNLTLTKDYIEYLYTIITRYEVNSMASDPFFHKEDKKDLTESCCLFWSDKADELQEKHEMNRIIKICRKCLYIDLFTYKIQLLINNKNIGLNDITIINANPHIANIFEILKKQSSLIYYINRRIKVYDFIYKSITAK